MWYCYTPVRAFYDLYPAFLSRQDFLTRQIFRAGYFFTGFLISDPSGISTALLAFPGMCKTGFVSITIAMPTLSIRQVDTSLYHYAGEREFLAFRKPALPGKKD